MAGIFPDNQPQSQTQHQHPKVNSVSSTTDFEKGLAMGYPVHESLMAHNMTNAVGQSQGAYSNFSKDTIEIDSSIHQNEMHVNSFRSEMSFGNTKSCGLNPKLSPENVNMESDHILQQDYEDSREVHVRDINEPLDVGGLDYSTDVNKAYEQFREKNLGFFQQAEESARQELSHERGFHGPGFGVANGNLFPIILA
jgi:hypothetical protein